MHRLFYFEFIIIIKCGAYGSKVSVNQFLNNHKKNLYGDKKTSYILFEIRLCYMCVIWM
jgi:hypothetical protein